MRPTPRRTLSTTRLRAPAALLLAVLPACAATAPAVGTAACASFLLRPESPGEAVRSTPTGLQVQEVSGGSGASARRGATVLVHYTGYLQATGEAFGSSCSGGRPLRATLGAGRMVAGFEQGVEGMREGGVRRLIVPPDLGYGTRGRDPVPGGATLVFDVHLVRVEAP